MIIPLDTTSQDAGALRAYGLVYQLLRKGIPVQWAIRTGKAAGGNDVTIGAPATVTDLETGAALASPVDYRGGPFIIDAADRTAALPIVNAWLGDDVTVVHTVAGTFTADIARTLTAAPRIALLQDGFEGIAIGNFNAAGIPDSTGAMWTLTSPDVLSEATVAGPTTTSHVDGGLWDAAGTAKYCNLTAMHYNATARTPEVVAEVRGWLKAAPGNHAFMECQAAATFENATAGRFLTSGGIETEGSIIGASLTSRFPDDPIAQTDGALEADGGAIDSIRLTPGSIFKSASDARTLINLSGTSTTSRIMLLSGHLDGVIANGRVTYLAGHDYSNETPLSGNPLTNGVKVLLNSLFETGCATAIGGQPVIRLTKAAAVASDHHRITYTIQYDNIGTGVANEAKITDQLPAGTTFVSASPEGSHAGGTVTWTLGNLPIGAAGSVEVTVAVTADGKYDNQAVADFKIGITPRQVTSNTVSTTIDEDGDDDLVTDDRDNCPAMANPDQADQDEDELGDACDPDRDGDGFFDTIGVSGGGCQVGGGGLGLGAGALVMMAGLALLRRRRRGAAILALLLGGAALPRPAAAQVMEPANFGVERFRLSSDREGMLDVEWAEARGGMAISAALWAGFASNPLVVYQGDPDDRAGELISDRMGGSLSLSISPRRWLQLGLDLPLVISQDRPASSPIGPMRLESLNSFGTSNLRVSPKLVVLQQADHGVSLAVIPAVILPTRSASDAYFDDRGFGFAPELALSKRWIGWRAGLDVGYRARRRATLLNQIVDDELFAHAGVGYQLADRGGPPLAINLTMSAATAARAPLQGFNENHLESLIGAAYDLTAEAQLFGATGVGLRKGFGTPDWRGLVGLRIGFGGSDAPSRARELDRDGDGLLDAADRCPDQPEDKDRFQDDDGCPDPDNDQDGVLDRDDLCMNVPGLVNLNGCPDGDIDGIADGEDRCPAQAEDLDAFEDKDGCPELDNETDGTPDVADACPLVAGPAENKGCPDTDREGDTVVDRLDRCPDEPGLPAKDGCPDVSIKDGRLDILESVYFKTDLAVIEPRSYALLDNVAAVLASHDQLKIQVEGYTDSQGNDAYNKKLSQRRTEAVVSYLVRKKIDRSRLTARGFGEEHPIADNATAEGRAQNRRVVFTILGGGDDVKTRVQGASDDTK